MKLEFDPDKGYGRDPVTKKYLVKDDYLSLPVVRWCHERIGPIDWPKDVNEILRGEGWEIFADWDGWLRNVDKPRTYVIIHTSLDTKLVTDFWMRFQ